MSLPAVRVLSLLEVCAALAADEPIACLVSIGDPGEPPPPRWERVAHRLRLEMVDAEHEIAGRVPTADDIRRLIGFAETIGKVGGPTVLHCRAAISRSTAATFIVFAVLLGPGREREAVEALYAIKPYALPNRLMVRLADELLGREGRLMEALLGRGSSG